MKTMSCNQLGGACEIKFHAETFEEIAELSKKHATEMFGKEDAANLEAKNQMRILMQSPEAMQNWFGQKRREFDELPED